MEEVSFDKWYEILARAAKREEIDISMHDKEYFRVSYERNDTPRGALMYLMEFDEI